MPPPPAVPPHSPVKQPAPPWATGCSGILAVRAGPAFCPAAFAHAVRAAGALFSVTVQMNPHAAAAIAAIGEDAWTPIRYPRAIRDDQLGCRVPDAEAAETRYTAFIPKKGQEITARLTVGRVGDLNRQPGQDELFPAWRYHAVFTGSPFIMLQAEARHRGHAQAEQVLADRADGPLARLPPGSFPARAAWLVLAAIARNLLRAAGSLPSLAYAKARGAAIRRDLTDAAARTARHGRGHTTLHPPDGRHREHERMNLSAACGPPPARTRPAQTRSPHPHPPRQPAIPGPERTPGQAAEQPSGSKPLPAPAAKIKPMTASPRATTLDFSRRIEAKQRT